MRISEAIALGRHLVDEPKSGVWTQCALGMASRAVTRSGYVTDASVLFDININWPWLRGSSVGCVACLAELKGSESIFHFFDYHVMQTAHGFSMTMEQLVDLVRAMEPPEEEPKELVAQQAKVVLESDSVAKVL